MEDGEAREIIHKLARLADAEGIETLGPEEALVVMAWWARGAIGNGGFEYFFEGYVDLPIVANAFRSLGLAEAADACEEVQSSIFIGGKTPAGEERRQAVLSRVDWNQFEEQEQAIFDVGWEQLLTKIREYIETHRAAFDSGQLQSNG